MNKENIGNENDIIFYNDKDGNINIEVILNDENIWLDVYSIAHLFDVQRPAIIKHIKNITLKSANNPFKKAIMCLLF